MARHGRAIFLLSKSPLQILLDNIRASSGDEREKGSLLNGSACVI